METKIRLKNLYLIAIIAIGLIGLGIGSTFAMFTAQATINNPIAFNSNLSSTNLLAETIEVTVPAGEDKYVDLVISNTSANSLNYSAWYTPSSNSLEVGSESSNNNYGPVGILPSAGNFTLTVGLRNNSNSPIAVTVGVSSSGDTIVLPSGVTSVPASQIPQYVSLSDFTYILGSDQTTITTLSADFYNSSNSTISSQTNVSLPASISISSNEVLLVRYIGTETEVKIPNTFTNNGNTYNVVLLSYVNDGNNLSTGVFYKNDDIEEVSFGNNIKYIALNSSSNGYDNYSMNNMFNGCTSLETVSNIPNTITNMDSTFTGCTSIVTAPALSSGVNNISNLFSGCTSLTTLNLSNVDLDDVTSYTNALNGVSTSSSITVSNCSQTNLFTSKFGYNYTGLNPSDFSCNYQQVEYIKSSGTQYIDTGYYLASNNITINTKVYTSSMPSAEQDIVSNQDGLTGRFVLGFYQNKVFGYSRNSGNLDTNTYSTTYQNSNTFEIEMNYNYTNSLKTMLVNNQTYTETQNATISNSNQTIKLLRRSDASGNFFVGRIYYFQLYVDDVLVKDYVPCYRLSDGIIGLYDTVNGEFYTNGNTAANADPFVAGPDVNS